MKRNEQEEQDEQEEQALREYHHSLLIKLFEDICAFKSNINNNKVTELKHSILYNIAKEIAKHKNELS